MYNLIPVAVAVTSFLLCGGPKQFEEARFYRQRQLVAGDTDAFEVACSNGKAYELHLVAADEAEFQVTVYDEFGRPMAESKTGSENECHVTWTATDDANYTVGVQNANGVAGSYSVVVQ